jgi:diguanylate cyclase (GGDEF)-like protein
MAGDADSLEQRRLAALHAYQILDTPPEEAFQEIAELASWVAATPIALISLVDEDRQWFKARVGLDLPETPRAWSFCARAIANPDRPMIISDALADPAYRDNPLVSGETGIRYYAGTPLLDPDGQALGTLCVIDTTPRSLSEKQVWALGVLSRRVVAEMELRRLLGEAARANAELADQARTDPLTSLANRYALGEQLNQEIAKSSRSGRPLSLLMIDLDHFKVLNDRFGHLAGDQVLAGVASCLREACRVGDLVGRYGGEELLAILPNTDRDGAAHFAERLRRQVLDWPLAHPVTVSIGVAQWQPGFSPKDLIRSADGALYRAKRLGRDQVQLA